MKLYPTHDAMKEAFTICERMAKTHYENFPIASWLLPKQLRPSMFSIYAFCRYTDDLGDEAPGNRNKLINQWEMGLRQCYLGNPKHPILIALQETIKKHNIPIEPFLNLIESERLDQQVTRYHSYEDLLSYCRHSAEPVGRMVLYVFGYRDKERQQLADLTCNALQLTNFWQDVRRDYTMGRIYIPLEDMAFFEYSETDLAEGIFNNNFKRLMKFQVERTRNLFTQGLELVRLVKGEFRLDIGLFNEGGLAVLDAIEKQNYNVLSNRPVVSNFKKTRLAISGITQLVIQRLVKGG